FNSTNPNLRKTATFDSDSHSTTVVQAGGPRNMVASATDNPALIDPSAEADNLNDGRNIGTNGPFMTVTITGSAAPPATHAGVSQALTTSQDSWVVGYVNGTDGASKPLFPMAPQSMFKKACTADHCHSCNNDGDCTFVGGTCTITNQTLAELTDTNLGQCGV